MEGEDIMRGFDPASTPLIGRRSNRPGPVRLVPYDPYWVEIYERERGLLQQALGADALDIQHIGSTSVPGLAAKPTVDIAIMVRPLGMAEQWAGRMASVDFIYGVSNEDEVRILFWKNEPYPINVHIVEQGSWTDLRHTLFRDWLRVHPDARMEYERKKRREAQAHADNLDGYTIAKSEFIEDIIERAAEVARIPYQRGNA